MYKSMVQLKVNCRLKVNYRIKFWLARPTFSRPAQIFSYNCRTFSLQFTFSCNSLVHDPALREQEESSFCLVRPSLLHRENYLFLPWKALFLDVHYFPLSCIQVGNCTSMYLHRERATTATYIAHFCKEKI